jgi:cytochrome c biogenesis protein CcmG, thiol:disulfide interchange protein DsbE
MSPVTRRRALLLGVVAVVVSAAAVVLSVGLRRDPSAVPSPLIGRTAPDFTLNQLDGKPFTLSTLRGQIVVVNFWASWCTECHTEQSTLNQTWQRFQDSGVVVVGVNFEDTTDDAIDYVRTASVSYPVVEDSDSRTALAYGLRGVPETFVIDRTGRIVDRIIGPVDATRLTNQITSMLPAGEQ